ncbi:hypothetical protein AA106555_1760 [Neokomagataea thailandica NBRC 106555]|uniref:Uncharacterized protein n=1 Tax=Neokomagataea thailandica NBRC 106555 TaxID=1223520 RepID=A0ABQ0QRX5_9PROT|nr:hypothetical protein AA106555_1760 [Neokomagataea thailandica NBRC 106555]
MVVTAIAVMSHHGGMIFLAARSGEVMTEQQRALLRRGRRGVSV